MGKEENLKKRKKFVKSDEKALKDGLDPVENGRKGGMASGKARKKKKQLKELANLILDNTIKDKSTVDRLKSTFPELENEDISYGLVLLLNLK